MITRISIRNFQRHKKLDIDLVHRITTITGDTDRGKSAILRAVIWALTNTPNGKRFVSHGQPGARVTLQIGKHELSRKRGAGKNVYVLDGKTFTAFGAEVPEEIARFLRISEINIQQQHDRAFWFHLSPAEISRRLNAIIDLGLIDEAQQRISSTVRKARSEVEFTRERYDLARAKVKELDYVPQFHDNVSALERMQQLMEQRSEACDSLAEDIDRLEALKHTLDQKVRLPDFSEIDSMIEVYDRREQSIEKLSLVIDQLAGYETAFKEADRRYETLHKQLHNIKGVVCHTCGQPIKS